MKKILISGVEREKGSLDMHLELDHVTDDEIIKVLTSTTIKIAEDSHMEKELFILNLVTELMCYLEEL